MNRSVNDDETGTITVQHTLDQGARVSWRTKITAAAGAIALAVVAFSGGPAQAVSFGPTTVWSPPAGGPETAAFYGRAMILKNSGHLNGTMLATFEQGTSGTPVFPIFRSSDSGRTWKQISTVKDTQHGWGMRYQPFLYELPERVGRFPAGTILAAGNAIPGDLSQTRLDVYASTDHGGSWRYVSEIAAGGKAVPNNGETPVWEPFLLAVDHKLIAYYSDQRDPKYGQKIVHQSSTDLVHWGQVTDDVTSPKYPSRPGMPTVARMPDGRYIMTYENYDYQGPEEAFAVYAKIATDPDDFGSVQGTVVRTSDGFVPVGSPYITWIPTGGPQGTLVMSAGNTPDLLVNTQGAAANTWTRVKSVVPGGYSRAVVPLPDGTSVFTITGGYGSGSGDYAVHAGADDLGGGLVSGQSYRVSTSSGHRVLGAKTFTQSSDDYYTIATRDHGHGKHGSSQEWAVAPSPAGGYTIVDRVSGSCFDRAAKGCRFDLTPAS